MERDDLGSWLSGPRAAAESAGVELGYPGERLGLPQQGPGSVAGWGRRFVALFIDWLVATGITLLFLPDIEPSSLGYSLTVLGIFAVEVALLTTLQHASFGQRVVGLRVVPLVGPSLRVAQAVARTVLVATVLPALLYDRDRRGLPDHVAKTVLVHTR
jgi:uncharacterized RDD family membrane protein YckC